MLLNLLLMNKNFEISSNIRKKINSFDHNPVQICSFLFVRWLMTYSVYPYILLFSLVQQLQHCSSQCTVYTKQKLNDCYLLDSHLYFCIFELISMYQMLFIWLLWMFEKLSKNNYFVIKSRRGEAVASWILKWRGEARQRWATRQHGEAVASHFFDWLADLWCRCS